MEIITGIKPNDMLNAEESIPLCFISLVSLFAGVIHIKQIENVFCFLSYMFLCMIG